MAEYQDPCALKATQEFEDKNKPCNNRAIKNSISVPSFRRTRLIIAGTCNSLDALMDGCARGKFFTDVESEKFYNKTYNI